MSKRTWRALACSVLVIALWDRRARAESEAEPSTSASSQPSESTPPVPVPPLDDTGWDVGWENILGDEKPQKANPDAKDESRPEKPKEARQVQVREAPEGGAVKAPNDLGPIPTTLTPVEYVRGPRAHDGFYLGVGYGVGLFDMSVQAGRLNGFYLSGVMKPLELRIGATTLPGLVIGASYLQGSVVEPEKLSSEERTLPSPKEVNLTGFGFFLDFYPWVDKGLHVSTTLRYCATDVKGDEGDADGWAYGAGVGYSTWVSSQWSLGLELQGGRGSFTRTRDNLDDTTEVTTALWSLAATASYH
ncbi:MAG: hypothetical protein SFV15_12385 [Polyangiaceae bacterium]|nr:hypothetical protein [Polyangiaceae bacterium]